jgi:hypothetical protein
MISVCIQLTKKIRLRASVKALTIVLNWLSISGKIPDRTSVRTWLCRLGVDAIKHARERHDDWICFANHSNQIGKEKVLAILGVRACHLPPPGQTLCRQHVRVLTLGAGHSVETSRRGRAISCFVRGNWDTENATDRRCVGALAVGALVRWIIRHQKLVKRRAKKQGRHGSLNNTGPPPTTSNPATVHGSTTSYLWCYTGLDDGHPYNIFDWTLTRQHAAVGKHLTNFQDTLVGDAFGGNARIAMSSAALFVGSIPSIRVKVHR